MSLDHAILGFLAYEPMTGYDLKKVFDSSVQNFWHATQSQIYRSLKKMEHDGWLRQEVIPQEDRPARKPYHLTDAGMDELMEWLDGPARIKHMRIEWLVKVFFSHRLPDGAIRGLFHARKKVLERKLKQLQTEAQGILDHHHGKLHSDRARMVWQLTLDHGVSRIEWELGWIEDALATLEHIPPE